MQILEIITQCARLYHVLVQGARQEDFGKFTPRQLTEMGRQAILRLAWASAAVRVLGQSRRPPGDFEPGGYHASLLVEALSDYEPRLLHYEGTRLVQTWGSAELRLFFHDYLELFAVPIAIGGRALEVLGKDLRRYALPRYAMAYLVGKGTETYQPFAKAALGRLAGVAQTRARHLLQKWDPQQRPLPDPEDVADAAFVAVLEELCRYEGVSLWDVVAKGGQRREESMAYLYTVVHNAACDEVFGKGKTVPPHLLDAIESESPEDTDDRPPGVVFEAELSKDPQCPYPERPSPELHSIELTTEINLYDSLAELRHKLTERLDPFAARYVEARVALALAPGGAEALTEEGRVKDKALAAYVRLKAQAFAIRKARWEQKHQTSMEDWFRQLQQTPDIPPILLALARHLESR